MGTYRIAQICLNGHCITDSVDMCPQLSQKFCQKCGAATITACPSCQASIRGDYDIPGVITIGYKYKVPSYCYSCGKPYPWTQAAIDATKALIEEEQDLTKLQQSQLVEILPDIITETPKTKLAAARFKKALLAVGKFTAEGLRQFVIYFGCELVKRELKF